MPTELRVLHPETREPLVSLRIPHGEFRSEYRIPLVDELQHLARFILTASDGAAPTFLPVETVRVDVQVPTRDIPRYMVP